MKDKNYQELKDTVNSTVFLLEVFQKDIETLCAVDNDVPDLYKGYILGKLHEDLSKIRVNLISVI